MLMEYLRRAVEDQASDLFIVAGGAVSEKLDGRLKALSEEKVFPKETQELITEIYRLADRPMDEYLRLGDDDFSFALPGLARFRVNAYRQRGSLAAVIRVVAFSIEDAKSILSPELISDVKSWSSRRVNIVLKKIINQNL